ncbi:MAG: hypothetical protein ACI8UO_005770, partial [Verrucomicrobiales bacterium]
KKRRQLCGHLPPALHCKKPEIYPVAARLRLPRGSLEPGSGQTARNLRQFLREVFHTVASEAIIVIEGEVRFQYFDGSKETSVGAPVEIFRKSELEEFFKKRSAEAAKAPQTFDTGIKETEERVAEVEPFAKDSNFFGNPAGLQMISHLRWMVSNSKKAQLQFPPADFYFETELPESIAAVETDSNGKFQIRFKDPGEPVVITSVVAFGSTITYMFSNYELPVQFFTGASWALELDENDYLQKQVQLSPQNDTTSGHAASILNCKAAYSSFLPDE